MLKRTFSKLRYSALIGAGIVLFTTAPAWSASLTYNMHPANGSGLPPGFVISAIFDDNVVGNPGAIRGRVAIEEGTYVGDIVAVYLDFKDTLLSSPDTIAAAITGLDITGISTNTKNVQGGSVGYEYPIGLKIGSLGIGPGHGDVQSTEFFLNTPGLTLADLGGIAVTLGSVGTEFDSRTLGGKVFGFPGKITETPEPGTWALLLSGGALVAIGRKKFRKA